MAVRTYFSRRSNKGVRCDTNILQNSAESSLHLSRVIFLGNNARVGSSRRVSEGIVEGLVEGLVMVW